MTTLLQLKEILESGLRELSHEDLQKIKKINTDWLRECDLTIEEMLTISVGHDFLDKNDPDIDLNVRYVSTLLFVIECIDFLLEKDTLRAERPISDFPEIFPSD